MKRLGRFTALLLALLLLLTACGQKMTESVGVCGGREIPYEELRHYALTYLESHPEASEEELRAEVTDRLLDHHALLALCAELLPNRQIDDEDLKKWAKNELKSKMEAIGGKSEFKKFLKENRLTEELFLRLLCAEQLRIELSEKVFAGTELESTTSLLAWLDAGNYVRVREIKLPANQISIADASTISLALNGGADPDTVLSSELTEKGAVISSPQYCYRGLEDSLTETAALSLSSVGSVSDVITENGNYIILLRVEDERETLVSFQLSTLFERYRTNRLNVLLEEKRVGLTVSWNELGNATVLRDLT